MSAEGVISISGWLAGWLALVARPAAFETLPASNIVAPSIASRHLLARPLSFNRLGSRPESSARPQKPVSWPASNNRRANKQASERANGGQRCGRVDSMNFAIQWRRPRKRDRGRELRLANCRQ